MEEDNQKVYILDTFNPYEKNDGVKRIFKIHDNWYCIRECKMNWGNVQTPHIDDEFLYYHIFNTYEEANEAASQIRRRTKI